MNGWVGRQGLLIIIMSSKMLPCIHTRIRARRCHRELKAGETLTRFERALLKVPD